MITVVIGLLSAVIGAAFAVEDRYLSKEDFAKDFSSFQIQQYDDKVFELDLKIANDTATAVDEANRKRYGERLQSLRDQNAK
jgi:hypothetical protein